MGWSRTASPTFPVYMDAPFEESLSRLRDHEMDVALDICESLERNGPTSGDGRMRHPRHGELLVRARSGVVVLFKEKYRGPRSYLAVIAGRCTKSGDSVVVELV